MKVYYAHCKAIYGTPQEARDIETLKALGFEVSNPSDPSVDEELNRLGLMGEAVGEQRMAWFEKFADECDFIAFRALPDRSVPAGVAKEIVFFEKRNKPVLELPGFVGRLSLTHLETKRYLKECGAR
jgi:hypothetical protein